MALTHEEITVVAADVRHRRQLWVRLIRRVGVRRVLELGVYKGEFAEVLLDRFPEIETYYLLDPWRNLSDWNKPANKDDDEFEQIYREAMSRTEAHADRRVILRGTTTEVIDQVDDQSLDLAYVDGDHTLRGISIDLISVWDKVRPGGLLGGDDFTATIWQHAQTYEPTLVFPFAVHFAEARHCPIYALPFRQFVIVKDPRGFSFTDLTGLYPTTELLPQLQKAR